MNSISNTRINKIKSLLSPERLIQQLPRGDGVTKHINDSRAQLEAIIKGKNKRLLAIVGPCSIHDVAAALDYAKKLKTLADKLNNKLCVVMRIYFEKPRTTIGWKGLINDPKLYGSFSINEGLTTARKLLLDINRLGIIVATEFVDTITPQYLSDLVSWVAIGARTTESQQHRMLASGLSMPVGFKNNTAGEIKAAVNAVLAAKHSHSFLGITEQGMAAIVSTKGNDSGHIILRGGTSGPNYSKEDINRAAELLAKNKLNARVIIDCSHDNCEKNFKKQVHVIDTLCKYLKDKHPSFIGFMLESNLIAGRQDLQSAAKIVYGQSITDGCIGWQQTETLLYKIADCIE